MIDTSPIADQSDISIHAPLAGCDRAADVLPYDFLIFQSTHPLRGATMLLCPLAGGCIDFNPRTPCGVRRHREGDVYPSQDDFNPRTPCGVRPGRTVTVSGFVLFQSTHPLRGATGSLHPVYLYTYYFNPRTPCGVRLGGTIAPPKGLYISIHAPLAGCDAKFDSRLQNHGISIHAPLAGCDAGLKRCRASGSTISIHAPLAGCDDDGNITARELSTFQSTHPLRGATAAGSGPDDAFVISIHAPLAGCDALMTSLRASKRISIHAPLAGCDLDL